MLLHAFLATCTKNCLLVKFYHIMPLMGTITMEQLYGVIDLMYDVQTLIKSMIYKLIKSMIYKLV